MKLKLVQHLLLFSFLLYATAPLGGCLPKPQASQVPTQAAPASGESCRFYMGTILISLPGPSGYNLKPVGDPLRRAASGWLVPAENIFSLYEQPGSKPDLPQAQDAAAQLLGRKVVIISALPEFTSMSVTDKQFSSIRNDLARMSGSWRETATADFMRLTETHYKNRETFEHSLGAYHQTSRSLSVVRIIKTSRTDNGRKTGKLPTGTTGVDDEATNLLASHNSPYLRLSQAAGGQAPGSGTAESAKQLNAKAAAYFASGDFTLSIRSLVCLRGKVFNVYFNTPLRGLQDFEPAMKANAAYLENITKYETISAASHEAGASGIRLHL